MMCDSAQTITTASCSGTAASSVSKQNLVMPAAAGVTATAAAEGSTMMPTDGGSITQSVAEHYDRIYDEHIKHAGDSDDKHAGDSNGKQQLDIRSHPNAMEFSPIRGLLWTDEAFSTPKVLPRNLAVPDWQEQQSAAIQLDFTPLPGAQNQCLLQEGKLLLSLHNQDYWQQQQQQGREDQEKRQQDEEGYPEALKMELTIDTSPVSSGLPSPAGGGRSAAGADAQAQSSSSSKHILLQQLLFHESSESWQDILEAEQPSSSRGSSRRNSSCGTALLQLDLPQSSQAEEMQVSRQLQDSEQIITIAGSEPAMPTAVECRNGAPMHFVQQELASPEGSTDSFGVAVAGEPYGSMTVSLSAEPSSTKCISSTGCLNEVSTAWCKFEGLEGLLSPGATLPDTPSSVACKNGWGLPTAAVVHQRTAAACDKSAAGRSAASAGAESGVAAADADSLSGCNSSNASVGSFVLYEAPTEADTSAGQAAAAAVPHSSDQPGCPVTKPVTMADLSDKLAAAELQCIQQQQEVVQVRPGLCMGTGPQLLAVQEMGQSPEPAGGACLPAVAAACCLLVYNLSLSSTCRAARVADSSLVTSHLEQSTAYVHWSVRVIVFCC
jgi:hypothetical protein